MPGLRKGARRLDRALRHAQAQLARHFAGIERAAPVDVHQVRVASRRIRSLLKTFRRHFRHGAADRYRRELGRVARQLSRLRQLDALATQPGMRGEAVSRTLRAARDAEVLRLQRRLRDARRWRKVVVDGPTIAQLGLDPDLSMDSLAQTISRRWRRVEQLLTANPSDPEALHALRISLKNLRYAIEAVQDAGDANVSAMLENLRLAQDVLGAERDAACAREWLAQSTLSRPLVRVSVRSLQRRSRVATARRTTVLRDLAQVGQRWHRSLR